MAKQKMPICKYNNIKIDASIKKNNKAKIRDWSKDDVKKKLPKRIESSLFNQQEHDNHDSNKSEDSKFDSKADLNEKENLNI